MARVIAGNQVQPAFAVSADGWLVTSGPAANASNAAAVLGDGRKAPIDEARVDPVSGLVLAHVNLTDLVPVSFADQAFARVGDFGFSLQTSGTGCAAQESMIGSDFLVDLPAGSCKVLEVQPHDGPPLPLKIPGDADIQDAF